MLATIILVPASFTSKALRAGIELIISNREVYFIPMPRITPTVLPGWGYIIIGKIS